MTSFVNKSHTRRYIETHSKRSCISADTVPYIEAEVRRLVLSIIKKDNALITTKSQNKLEPAHIKRAIKELFESGEILTVYDLDDRSLNIDRINEVWGLNVKYTENGDNDIKIDLENNYKKELVIRVKVE